VTAALPLINIPVAGLFVVAATIYINSPVPVAMQTTPMTWTNSRTALEAITVVTKAQKVSRCANLMLKIINCNSNIEGSEYLVTAILLHV